MQSWRTCRFCVSPRGQNWERELLENGQFWDVETFMHIMRMAAKQHDGRCLLIDVGANVGLWSVRAAAEGFSVISVEPDPRNIRRLEVHAALNGARVLSRLAVVQAVGAADVGRAELLQSPKEGMLSLTVPLSHESPDVARAAAARMVYEAGGGQVSSPETLEVPAISLDALLGSTHHLPEFDLQHHSCAFLKVDAEGDDPDVLRGARSLIQSEQLLGVLVEEHKELLALKGHMPGASLKLLAASDFKWTHLVDFNPDIRNILAVRPHVAAQMEVDGFELSRIARD
eukprot:TRINITY_DN62236_c0_g1_i1.p1 TRINITY_DN62236_c0_g1~~TRINITY_DN62236_c0_g1_i1.p1  ORF type:complete len:286 (+),score=72.68 TRINITY_DN62236_c0_g1_i1:338-1195(+)